jgi:branched-chain amino acid transport system ATP-binding protein
MIQIKNLKSGYNGVEILKGVDIFVKSGEIVALIGPNGAGKSTLLKSIFSLSQIYDGKIIYNNKDITNVPTYELINLGVGFVPQGRQIFSNMTVAENLEMGAFMFRDKNNVKKRLIDVYEKMPMLYDKRKENALNLSGGQQQLLALARSLIQNPSLLLMDEPSLGLAPIVVREMFEKIVEINNEGVTVIIVEQNAKQAVVIADRTYVLENGIIAMEGDKSILSDKRIKNIYFGGE